jgi:transcriptional regulator with XRE-family HTH domain
MLAGSSGMRQSWASGRAASITPEVMAARPGARYCRGMQTQSLPVGELVRHWRLRRRLSQLDLACEAEISTRHLSFIETGRAAPSREMILHLAESLDVPLRQRNALLLAAGFRPVFHDRSLDDPALAPARVAIEALLSAHEPYPALTIDRHWNLIAANRALAPLIAGAAPELLKPPVNVLRLSLHPAGLAPRIANLGQWRDHLLFRLRRRFAETADPALSDLLAELTAYPHGGARSSAHDPGAIAVPLQFRAERGILLLLSATMMFGAPLDPTLAELALETFLPADAATAEALRKLVAR